MAIIESMQMKRDKRHRCETTGLILCTDLVMIKW